MGVYLGVRNLVKLYGKTKNYSSPSHKVLGPSILGPPGTDLGSDFFNVGIILWLRWTEVLSTLAIQPTLLKWPRKVVTY
jgi:hypothetical protein